MRYSIKASQLPAKGFFMIENTPSVNFSTKYGVQPRISGVVNKKAGKLIFKVYKDGGYQEVDLDRKDLDFVWKVPVKFAKKQLISQVYDWQTKEKKDMELTEANLVLKKKSFTSLSGIIMGNWIFSGQPSMEGTVVSYLLKDVSFQKADQTINYKEMAVYPGTPEQQAEFQVTQEPEPPQSNYQDTDDDDDLPF